MKDVRAYATMDRRGVWAWHCQLLPVCKVTDTNGRIRALDS